MSKQLNLVACQLMVAIGTSNECEKSLYPTRYTLSRAIFFSGIQSLLGLIVQMPFKRPNCWGDVSSKHSLLHDCDPPVHSTERFLTFIFFHYCHITCKSVWCLFFFVVVVVFVFGFSEGGGGEKDPPAHKRYLPTPHSPSPPSLGSSLRFCSLDWPE